MKLLIFNFEYPPLGGGGGVATRQIAEELSRRHEVHVITSGYGNLRKEEKKNGVSIHRVAIAQRKSLPTATIVSMVTYIPSALWRGYKVCRESEIDVINAQFVVPSGIPAAILAQITKKPFVLSFIGGDVYDPTKGISPHKHWWLKAIIKWVARKAKTCTAISSDTKRRVKKYHKVKTPIEVTPLGIKKQEIETCSRRELGVPTEGYLFVSIGRLIPRKGYDVLLEAWQGMAGATLIIIGSGPLERELIDMSDRLGIKDRVKFLGYISEDKKTAILKAADGYVSATEHEGFGIVFLEAMQVGLPIVSTNNGGQTDFLIDGENAFLTAVGDSQAIARGVRRIIKDRELAGRMSRANKEKVKQFYLEKTVKQFEDVLNKAVNY